MLSDKIGNLKQDLAYVKGKLNELQADKELLDKFAKLEDDLKEYLEGVENCLTELR